MPSVTWDTAFEASPADTDEAKYGANKIRQLKTAISERLELEMNFKTGTQPLVKAGQAATCYEGTTAAITALTSMATGAFAWDSTLKTFKRYSGTAWDAKSVIPSGTKMLFYADVAPVGWTIDNTLDDKLIFVTKGSVAGGQTGGGVHSTGSWTISGVTVTADSHVLTVAEIPSHQHLAAVTSAGYNDSPVAGYPSPKGSGYTAAVSDDLVGGGGGHTHTATTVSAGTWRPSAYCCIICSKD